MKSGEWDKEQLQAEVQAHDDIFACTEDQSKNKNSKGKYVFRPLADNHKDKGKDGKGVKPIGPAFGGQW